MAAAKRKQDVEEMEEVEGVEEASSGGVGLDTGMIIVTTVALLLGIVVGFLELGHKYGVGPFGNG